MLKKVVLMSKLVSELLTYSKAGMKLKTIFKANKAVLVMLE